MKKFFLFLITSAMLSFSNSAFATHYMGSEIYYFDLGNNQYQIHYVAYTDCSGVAPPVNIPVEITSSCTGTTSLTLNKDVTLSGEVPSVCSSVQTTCNGGSNWGILRSHYVGVTTLSPCSDWVISFSTCCRNGFVSNLQNPTGSGATVEATLNNATGLTNNSPNINSTEPIFFGCVGDTLYDAIEAFETDGDSLVFSLTPCLEGSGINVAPVSYASGLSSTNPLSGGSVTIDPSTGLLTIHTTIAQSAVICVKVEEYRNGTIISETMRDYQLNILNCTNDAPNLQTINGGNPTTNAQHTIAIGQTLTVDFYVHDSEVVAGIQTLTDSLFTNLNASITNNGNGNFTLTYTPTATNELGQHDLVILVKDDNCPMIGQTSFTIGIEVISLPFTDAIDDVFSTFENLPVSGNVLINDLSSSTLTPNSTPVLSPSNGVVTLAPDGVFTYTPNPNFIGIDSFQYEAFNLTSQSDVATVYINVQPTPLPTFDISDTIVLGESYPNYYCLTDSAYYQSDTSSNAVLTFVNNTCFDLYGDYLGTDTVILASANEIVNFHITVVNGVWPGDTDDDAIVNNVDLLNIGLAYNSVGIPRSQQSILWNGYLANDWGTTFTGTNLDYKHADTNGDGMIDANDTLAIVQNWGLSYNKNGGNNGAPIYLETDSMTIVNDSIAYIPIMLGTITNPVSNIYGLAFTINYNSTLVEDSSVMVHFDPSWLGVDNLDMISIGKDFYYNQLTEVAVTRINGNPMSGNGQLGRMCFTIQDDIIRGVDSLFTFDITNVVAIDNNNTTVDLQGEERAIHWDRILEIANNTQNVNLSNHLQVYPNPATDHLTISAKAVTIESVEIFDMTGRKVLSEYSFNNRNQLNISELNEGFYIVHIKTDLGILNEKIMVVKP